MIAGVPASAQPADPYAFCYADPPTYRSGTLVYTRVRFVGVGAIDLFEVGNALAETSRQVQGRQASCWRYPNEQVAEAKRQEGMARDRSRGYVVVESEWQPSRVNNVPVMMPAPMAPPPQGAQPATIAASPVPDADTQPTAPLPPVSAPGNGASVAADIDRAISEQAAVPAPAAPAAAAAVVAPPPAPAPDLQTGAVANLNAGVAAAEAARLNAAAQVQADYQRQLAEHAREVAAIRARNERAQAEYQAAVKACAAGDFSKCGGPPVPVKQD
ncbi:MAG: hypothetical protein Q7J32_17765 [Sphingomonadaceae bacterium]|nr:hypothetical protein [Sphingomonadaceae bacterium]